MPSAYLRRLSSPTLKPWTVYLITNCGKLLKRWEYQTTCLLRSLYTGQEATIRMLYRTDWFRAEKGVCQDGLLSPCLFNSYAEHVMRNAGLDELQAGIKIGERNINSLRYVDDNTLKKVQSLLMRVKDKSEKPA